MWVCTFYLKWVWLHKKGRKPNCSRSTILLPAKSISMAQQQRLQVYSTNNISYREVQLLKEEILGIGSYGSVYKAMCDGLLCAAKVLHPTLFDPSAHWQISRQREHRLPICRFETECAFLEEIRHPNVIQYLGVYRDPETGLPVLLMELMDESLTHFLESSTTPIPCYIQVNICLDIARALSFLHLNGIIHRDLSSNNILLTGKCRAKLTDFGMAKLVNVHMTGRSNTICPGTDAYMPPEAIDNQGEYTEKGDVFSFGVNVLQVLTRKFPKPGNRHKTVYIDHPQFPSGTARVCCSEIERRHNHISIIDGAHPLLTIALNCLKDQHGERASASELCHRLGALKDTPKYIESQRRSQQHDNQITELQEQLLSQEQHYQQQVQSSLQTITDRQQEIQDLRQELTATTAHVREQEQLHSRIKELEQLLDTRIQSSSASARDVQHPQPINTERELKLNWVRGKDAPFKLHKSTDAVVDGGMVYLNLGGSKRVYAFDSTTEAWSRFPDCPIELTTLAVVKGLLTTIGGWKELECFNQLFSLTGTGRHRHWNEVHPPMPTERCFVSAATTGTVLIVAGGERRDETLTAVEILCTITQQWSIAESLPEPVAEAAIKILGDKVYVLGGFSDIPYSVPSKTVGTCSLSSLLVSCHRTSIGLPVSVWSTAAQLPVCHPTCISLHDRLLAVGGEDDLKADPVTDIHMYDQTNNSWRVISHLGTSRSWCFAVVLPDHRIMAVGGYIATSVSSGTETVEFATLN